MEAAILQPGRGRVQNMGPLCRLWKHLRDVASSLKAGPIGHLMLRVLHPSLPEAPCCPGMSLGLGTTPLCLSFIPSSATMSALRSTLSDCFSEVVLLTQCKPWGVHHMQSMSVITCSFSDHKPQAVPCFHCWVPGSQSAGTQGS